MPLGGKAEEARARARATVPVAVVRRLGVMRTRKRLTLVERPQRTGLPRAPEPRTTHRSKARSNHSNHLESLESLARSPVGPRSPARRVVVHGSRTSRATYAVGDRETRGTRVEKRPASGSRMLFFKAVFSNASPRVSAEAFAKRASAAFRAALGRLVIAEVDAWMDREGMASVDAWARAERASLATFAARAATLAAEDAAAGLGLGPRRRLPFFPMTTRARERAKAASRARRPPRLCERCDALDVERVHRAPDVGPRRAGLAGRGRPGRTAREKTRENARFSGLSDLGPLTDPGSRASASAWSTVATSPRAPRFGASLADVLSPATVAALAATGVRADALFSHQSSAVAAAARRVVVATGTASGKSACYNAPAFEALFRDPDATALYLFPTKALARDQLGKIRTMLAGAARRASRAALGLKRRRPRTTRSMSARTTETRPRTSDRGFTPLAAWW